MDPPLHLAVERPVPAGTIRVRCKLGKKAPDRGAELGLAARPLSERDLPGGATREEPAEDRVRAAHLILLDRDGGRPEAEEHGPPTQDDELDPVGPLAAPDESPREALDHSPVDASEPARAALGRLDDRPRSESPLPRFDRPVLPLAALGLPAVKRPGHRPECTLAPMPEGDSLHRAAESMRALEGEVVAVQAPHPRAAALGIAERIDGRRLERVEAVGKNLLLTFEGGLILRSHLRMRGRWRVQPSGTRPFGTPWLVLSGGGAQAVLWNGPVLELGPRAVAQVRRLGPDIMETPPDLDGMVARFRAADRSRELGEALLDQRLVAGLGNMWRAEALWAAEVSPWISLRELPEAVLRGVLGAASAAMREGRRRRQVYRRTGLPCRRCGATIASRAQGDEARIAYWCPTCQAGTGPAGA